MKCNCLSTHLHEVFVFFCVFFLRFRCFVFFCVFVFFLRFRFFAFFLRSRVNGYRSICFSFSFLSYNMTLFFIKNQKNMFYTYFQRQSNYFLYIKELFIICRLLYNAPIEMRFFASSFLCVFVFFAFFFAFFLRFRFFAFSFFLRLRSLKYASSFFSQNENDVNLAVASTVGCAEKIRWRDM